MFIISLQKAIILQNPPPTPKTWEIIQFSLFLFLSVPLLLFPQKWRRRDDATECLDDSKGCNGFHVAPLFGDGGSDV